jgi:preprotein translocase subunit SecD
MKIQPMLILILSGMVFTLGVMADEQPLQLNLSADDISEVRFWNATRIVLKLSDPATENLRKLTSENIGKKLEVTYMDMLVVSAIINAEIKTGHVGISHPSDFIWNEMKRLQEKIMPDQQ